jgi:hypothetical protein
MGEAVGSSEERAERMDGLPHGKMRPVKGRDDSRADSGRVGLAGGVFAEVGEAARRRDGRRDA